MVTWTDSLRHLVEGDHDNQGRDGEAARVHSWAAPASLTDSISSMKDDSCATVSQYLSACRNSSTDKGPRLRLPMPLQPLAKRKIHAVTRLRLVKLEKLTRIGRKGRVECEACREMAFSSDVSTGEMSGVAGQSDSHVRSH